MLIKRRNSTDSGHATVAPIGETSAKVSRPEFYRLPTTGGDPFFGLTRSFYYEGESRGYWRLVRLRQRGKQRGITLVPFDAVAEFIRQQIHKDEPQSSESVRCSLRKSQATREVSNERE